MRFILWSVDWEATSSLLQPAFVLVAPGFRESGIAASTRLKSNPAKHPKRTALQHANAVNACTVNAVFLSAYTRQSSESRIRPLPCLALRYLFCPGSMNSSKWRKTQQSQNSELKLLMLHTKFCLDLLVACHMPVLLPFGHELPCFLPTVKERHLETVTSYPFISKLQTPITF